MIVYMSYLLEHGRHSPALEDQALSPSSLDGAPNRVQESKWLGLDAELILAGYSYGAMVASHLPSIDVVLKTFQSPNTGTNEAEISLRASHLAKLHIKELRAQSQQSRGHPSLTPSTSVTTSSHAVAVGGSESNSRRISRESSRTSLDRGVRKSLDLVKEKLGGKVQRNSEEGGVLPDALVDTTLRAPLISLLLVSPILPPVSLFTTMFSNPSFTKAESDSSQYELTANPTLAVYGDRDTFTSQKRLRRWADTLRQQPGSRFRSCEVEDAGHFWREEGVEEKMRSALREWLANLTTER